MGVDRISNLPDRALVRILECLTLREAVRTSVLSQAWQFQWTNLTEVCFGPYFPYDYYNGREVAPVLFVNTVQSVLLQLNGPTTEITLHIPDLDAINEEDIYLIIPFCLRRGVRVLRVINTSSELFPRFPGRRLSSYVSQLTKLELVNCSLVLPTNFGVFPNLKVLILKLSASLDFQVVFDWVRCLIVSSPNLEDLKITEGGEELEEMDSVSLFQENSKVYADCSLRYLRRVTIENVSGTIAEVAMIKFLLSSSIVLEVMSVIFEPSVDDETKLKVCTEVTGFCQIFPGAVVMFPLLEVVN